MHARPSSAAMILEDANEQALIVKAHYKAHWTFPGGIIDANETPKQASMREVAEEVGLVVQPESVCFGWVVARHSVVADSYQFIFKAALDRDLLQGIVLQANEIADWRLVSKADVLSQNLVYATIVQQWACNNTQGYFEQTLSIS